MKKYKGIIESYRHMLIEKEAGGGMYIYNYYYNLDYIKFIRKDIFHTESKQNPSKAESEGSVIKDHNQVTI